MQQLVACKVIQKIDQSGKKKYEINYQGSIYFLDINPFSTVIGFFVNLCVCPTILLFQIWLTPHIIASLMGICMGTPSLPNENVKILKTVLKGTVGSERVNP